MTVVDTLLGIDNKKFKLEEKEVKIKSLSEKAGQDVKFKIRALSTEEFDEISELTTTINKKGASIDTAEMQKLTVIKGIVEPDLKNQQLLDKFNCDIPKDLLKLLLKAGEVTELYTKISELSGFEDDVVEEVKN